MERGGDREKIEKKKKKRKKETKERKKKELYVVERVVCGRNKEK